MTTFPQALADVLPKALLVAAVFGTVWLLGHRNRPKAVNATDTAKQWLHANEVPLSMVEATLLHPELLTEEGDCWVAHRDGLKVRYLKGHRSLLVVGFDTYPSRDHPAFGNTVR